MGIGSRPFYWKNLSIYWEIKWKVKDEVDNTRENHIHVCYDQSDNFEILLDHKIERDSTNMVDILHYFTHDVKATEVTDAAVTKIVAFLPNHRQYFCHHSE